MVFKFVKFISFLLKLTTIIFFVFFVDSLSFQSLKMCILFVAASIIIDLCSYIFKKDSIGDSTTLYMQYFLLISGIGAMLVLPFLIKIVVLSIVALLLVFSARQVDFSSGNALSYTFYAGVFLTQYTLFGLVYFFDLSSIYLYLGLLICCVIYYAMLMKIFGQNAFDLLHITYLVISYLLLVQILIIMQWLPLHFSFKAIVFTLLLILQIQSIWHIYYNNLNQNILRYYVIIVLVVMVIAFLITPWSIRI